MEARDCDITIELLHNNQALLHSTSDGFNDDLAL